MDYRLTNQPKTKYFHNHQRWKRKNYVIRDDHSHEQMG